METAFIKEQFENLFSLTIEQIQAWFVYNPKNPLLFSSGLFLGFFLIFYLIYIATRKHTTFRIAFVTIFSLFFYYKSGGYYLILILISSALDYILANLIHRSQNKNKRRLFLIFSITSSLGLLGYFKYTNFLLDSFNHILNYDFAFQDIILPVGISFYTFQTMSYTIDVYRREIEPAKTFLDFTFFVCFFPQLVAGPIVRAKDFIPQIYQKISLSKEEANTAFFLIIGGLLKKAVISDYISLNFVDRVFDAPNSYTAFENLMAIYGYTLQIYCDFSGYSDMAIGLALLMGFRLPENFRTPYQSQNITEFWRRWHISLSSWLRDYLYIAVGGNRKGTFLGYLFPSLFFVGALIWAYSIVHLSMIPLIVVLTSLTVFLMSFLLSKNPEKSRVTNFNLVTTMLLGGLWHGASLRFIIWGALHGLALTVHKLFIEKTSSEKQNRENVLKKILAIFLTFHFVAFCWIFFRAKDFPTALDLIRNIVSLDFNPSQWFVILQAYQNVFLLFFIGYVWHFFPISLSWRLQNMLERTPILFKALLGALVFWIVYATASSGPQPFIYFQF